ncbi:DNA-primase RepB domain-containing protein [Marivita sp. S0852]|uniref:DNA-primase RepB domain-containing protein n=1 Tax=Marivita sp. S0852 TaxID=3373893 RepID=UPI003982BD8B
MKENTMADQKPEKYIYRTKFPALMAEGASERDVLQDQDDFLGDLWYKPAHTGPDKFGNLCFRRKGTTKMIDKFVSLRDRIKIDHLLLRYDRYRFDQYFSPNVYARPSRKVGGVLITRLGWCDVDKADPFAFDPKPSVVWETSPGRTQALWFWDRPHTPAQASAFSKSLTYRHGGDKGGSAANKLLRLPGSFNHKPEYDRPFIPLVHFDPRPITVRPKLLTGHNGAHAAEPEALDMNPHAHERLNVLKKYRSKLDASTRSLIRHNRAQASDRSSRIFAMVAGLHEAGATLDEIASVIWSSPYFRDKYGDDINALETEVSRIITRMGVAQ